MMNCMSANIDFWADFEQSEQVNFCKAALHD